MRSANATSVLSRPPNFRLTRSTKPKKSNNLISAEDKCRRSPRKNFDFASKLLENENCPASIFAFSAPDLRTMALKVPNLRFRKVSRSYKRTFNWEWERFLLMKSAFKFSCTNILQWKICERCNWLIDSCIKSFFNWGIFLFLFYLRQPNTPDSVAATKGSW